MTDVALKEYLEAKIEALRREIELLREADRRALELASTANMTRLEHMNEFRAQILEDRRLYVRVDTFKWAVGVIVALFAALVALMSVIIPSHGAIPQSGYEKPLDGVQDVPPSPAPTGRNDDDLWSRRGSVNVPTNGRGPLKHEP